VFTDIKWCKSCVSMNTRPRITFDERGFCNACVWAEEKKTLDWKSREDELLGLLDSHRDSRNGGFDCIVPVSGGKDGSYVAYNLKHKYGMNPLTVTVTPPLELELGKQNLSAFIESGYDHISINPNPVAMQALNKHGFVEMGFPYYGWLLAIQAAPVVLAHKLGINLIFYGEDGEVEYGGTGKTKSNPFYDVNYMKEVYLEGGVQKVLDRADVDRRHLNWFSFPTDVAMPSLKICHWSYFENWDPYRNYLVAKKYCGLMESQTSNAGTFTNFAQNDQALYSLHAHLMFLKFGFGRANQDACIEIRRGAMSRNQACHLVKLYDGNFPSEFLDLYLEYYGMHEAEFFDVLKRWTNEELFRVEGRVWKPLFEIK